MTHGLLEFTPAPGRDSGKVYYYIPEHLDLDKPAPLFVFMHGGARNTPDEAPAWMLHDPVHGRLEQHLDHTPFITVAASALPAIDGKRWNRVGAVKYILDIIEDACSRYLIDRDRIIIGGHSMGGFGAYHIGQILADKAAGVLLSAGAWNLSDFRSLYGTPAYILHGRYDCAAQYRLPHPEPRHHDWCGVSFARAAHALMTRYCVEHVYDEHEGGHGLSWEPSQMAFIRFLQWAEPRRRNPYPRQAVLVTPRGSADPDMEERPVARYLEIIRQVPGDIDYDAIRLLGPNIAWTVQEFLSQTYDLTKVSRPGARLIASNLGNNRFAVKAENVAEFAIRLAPQMGDLDRPFIVDAGPLGTRELTPQPLDGDGDYCAQIQWRD